MGKGRVLNIKTHVLLLIIELWILLYGVKQKRKRNQIHLNRAQ